ncbi:MAG: hypothetical protein PHE79_10785 [Eubacteriales bacterium]|nr:hypothetical protein [Eubacteriales bacterium]
MLDQHDEQDREYVNPELSRTEIEGKIENINNRLLELKKLKQTVKITGTSRLNLH